MDNTIFLELSLVLVVAGVVSAIMKALRQPLIIGYIFTGLLLGPYFLGIFEPGRAYNSFAQFGVALLLFLIGLGLNPRIIKEVGRAAVIVGTGQILFTTGFGFAAAKLLGFSTLAGLYIAIALAFSSTIIVLKILSDKKETAQLYAKVATGFLLVQDVVATIILVFVAGAGEGGLPLPQLSLTAGFGLLLAAALAVASRSILPRMNKFLSNSQEFLFLFALGWGFGVASLFALGGLSVEVGALFAGVALATQPYAQEVSSRLRPLRDFFIILFFIVLGAELNLTNVNEVIVPGLIFAGVVIIGNPLIVMAIMGLMGYTKKTSFKTALTVSQISEFSLILIILARTVGQVSDEVVSIVTLVALLTIASSTYMMLFDDKLYELLERKLSFFERRKIKYEQRKLSATPDIVLVGLNEGGIEFTKVFEKLGKKFLVIDYDPESIDQLKHSGIPHAYGDATDAEFLDEIGIENAKMVVSTMTNFKANLFVTTHVHSQNKDTIIIAHSESLEEASELYDHGATYVMMPHYIGSERVSRMISRHGLRKSHFTPAREKHIRYVRGHLT